MERQSDSEERLVQIGSGGDSEIEERSEGGFISTKNAVRVAELMQGIDNRFAEIASMVESAFPYIYEEYKEFRQLVPLLKQMVSDDTDIKAFKSIERLIDATRLMISERQSTDINYGNRIKAIATEFLSSCLTETSDWLNVVFEREDVAVREIAREYIMCINKLLASLNQKVTIMKACEEVLHLRVEVRDTMKTMTSLTLRDQAGVESAKKEIAKQAVVIVSQKQQIGVLEQQSDLAKQDSERLRLVISVLMAIIQAQQTGLQTAYDTVPSDIQKSISVLMAGVDQRMDVAAHLSAMGPKDLAQLLGEGGRATRENLLKVLNNFPTMPPGIVRQQPVLVVRNDGEEGVIEQPNQLGDDSFRGNVKELENDVADNGANADDEGSNEFIEVQETPDSWEVVSPGRQDAELSGDNTNNLGPKDSGDFEREEVIAVGPGEKLPLPLVVPDSKPPITKRLYDPGELDSFESLPESRAPEAFITEIPAEIPGSPTRPDVVNPLLQGETVFGAENISDDAAKDTVPEIATGDTPPDLSADELIPIEGNFGSEEENRSADELIPAIPNANTFPEHKLIARGSVGRILGFGTKDRFNPYTGYNNETQIYFALRGNEGQVNSGDIPFLRQTALFNRAMSPEMEDQADMQVLLAAMERLDMQSIIALKTIPVNAMQKLNDLSSFSGLDDCYVLMAYLNLMRQLTRDFAITQFVDTDEGLLLLYSAVEMNDPVTTLNDSLANFENGFGSVGNVVSIVNGELRIPVLSPIGLTERDYFMREFGLNVAVERGNFGMEMVVKIPRKSLTVNLADARKSGQAESVIEVISSSLYGQSYSSSGKEKRFPSDPNVPVAPVDPRRRVVIPGNNGNRKTINGGAGNNSNRQSEVLAKGDEDPPTINYGVPGKK